MISFQLQSNRAATKSIFLSEDFDFFHLVEFQILTFVHFSIDGHINSEVPFESDSEIDSPALHSKNVEYALWKQIRPFGYQMIKGKQVPSSFKILYFLDKQEAAAVCGNLHLAENADIKGYCLNFQYKNNALQCSTGTSYERFSMNRENEREWDHYIISLFQKLNLERQN